MPLMPDKIDGDATEREVASQRISELERWIVELEDECFALHQEVALLEEQLELVRFAARPLS